MSAIITGDLRSASLQQRREKERRVKYRGVNVNLMGRPVGEWVPLQKIRGSSIWTATNRYRMKDWVGQRQSCHCPSCKRYTGKMNRRKSGSLSDVVCTATVINRKVRPGLNLGAVDDFRDMYYSCSSEDGDDPDAYMDDIAYSYDHAGPGHELSLSYAVTQAVEKFESKELALLIKNEYEFVEESETDEEFELI